jgi:ATP-binding protein involved in chromosome partitioning
MIKQFVYKVDWGLLDYLIVDMPPGTGDAQLTMAQAVPMAGAVIVTTPQVVANNDARRGLNMFLNMGVDVLGLVENMAYFIPPDMPDKKYHIFGTGGAEATSKALGVSLLGSIPLEIPVREGGDGGCPIVVANPESASAQALVAVAKSIAAMVSIASWAKSQSNSAKSMDGGEGTGTPKETESKFVSSTIA